MCSLGEGCEDIKKPRAALWNMGRQNPLCIDFRMSGKLGLTKCIVWMSKKTTQLQPRSLLRLWRKKGRKKLGNITFRLTEIWQIWREMFRLRVQTLDSPSPWQEVDFDKWVRVAIVVPRGQVSGLQHVDDQVSQLLVIVDLKLQERRKEKKWMEGNFRLNEAETTWQRGKCENKDFRNDYHAVPVSLQRWGETGSLFHLQSVKFKWHKFISCQWTTVGVGVLVGFYCTSHWIKTPNERVF